ncbi:MAG: S-methyl-5-thioribose-1-phosphate isomerase [Halobacteria archaeon]
MRTIEWDDDRDCVVMVDQTKLPSDVTEFRAETVDELVESIEMLRVRGAPALGAAGGFGVALASREIDPEMCDGFEDYVKELDELSAEIADARPTAVNLSREVDSILEAALEEDSVEKVREVALREAKDLADRDVETNKRIGENGAELLDDGDTVMTHCNAGALATVDWGTALGVIYSAREEGKDVDVVANETRPLNQGSRITAVELLERDVPTTLIPDNASGLCLQKGEVDAVVVGADRIVLEGGKNDDGAIFNKIGTYKHAVLANRHDVPFVVAAPTSTIDRESSAEEVEIEERDASELREIYGEKNAPEDLDVHNPAFDETPMEFVDYVVTENGVFRPPFEEKDLIETL